MKLTTAAELAPVSSNWMGLYLSRGRSNAASGRTGQTHLCTRNDVILLRKDVNKLALALVSPLRSQHHSDLRIELAAG